MNSGVKFTLYSLSAVLFIGGLNSIVNGEETAGFILWLLPFLCLGTGIGIPILILFYETYFNNEALESTDDHSNSSDNEENSDNEHNG
jgi:hypothetical protein